MEVADNTLINTSYPDDTNARIESINTTVTESNFPLNKWGYSEDNGTTYNQIATKSKIVDIDHAINSNTTTLRFATKMDINKPSGNYGGTIRFVAVTNYVPMSIAQAYAAAGKTKVEVEGNRYYQMQDMSSEICEAADIDEAGIQVVDTRDSKLYWIAKLKDNNCWMTQNLDLDLSTSTTLTSDTTDLAAGTTYKPAVSTKTGNVFNNSSYTGENSWDGGNYYWKGPDTWLDYADNPAGYGSDTFKSAFSTNIADAGTAGKHYHVGNIYQWSAATAKTGNGKTSGAEATSSICPKGWRLPYSGNNTTDKSFGYMLSKYSLTSDNTNHNINKTPLYFVPAGYVTSGKLNYAADNGYYWSSRVYSNTDTNFAYLLFFYTSSVFPSHNYPRYFGLSIRCVAR